MKLVHFAFSGGTLRPFGPAFGLSSASSAARGLLEAEGECTTAAGGGISQASCSDR